MTNTTKQTKPKTPKKGIAKTLAMAGFAATAALAPMNKAEAKGHHHHGRNVGAALVGGFVGGLVAGAVREALTPEPEVVVLPTPTTPVVVQQPVVQQVVTPTPVIVPQPVVVQQTTPVVVVKETRPVVIKKVGRRPPPPPGRRVKHNRGRGF